MLQASQGARPLIQQLQGRMQAIAERTRGLADWPTVAAVEWIDPLMAAGNWMPELIEMAGGISLFGVAAAHFAVDDMGGIVRVRPRGDCCDAVRLRHRADQAGHAAAHEQAGVGPTPLRESRPRLPDRRQSNFNRPGPRLVESLEILAEILHPEEFAFGHEGTGWQRVK